ncbi:hypothetical protein QBB31_14115 [Streptomyces scabiei]|uniref:hypothetical protein n=1 Tax=Streptomyces scabiei TaxID=1930 RepID=UPI002FF382C7
MASEPLSYWILLLDIQDFGQRPETIQTELREALYRAVQFAFETAGLDFDLCPVQDRGDSVLILVPAGTSPTKLLGELVHGLEHALVAHNRMYNDSHLMRLRVGLNHGYVVREGSTWIGSALNDVARLVDAPPVKQVLSQHTRAQLVLVISDEIHRSVVQAGYPGIDSGAYVRADFVSKGEARRGWVAVPGYRPLVGPTAEVEGQRGLQREGAEALIHARRYGEVLTSSVALLSGQFDAHRDLNEATFVVRTAEETLDHTLARLFAKLGPPPEPTEQDHTPAGTGGGGAEQ